MADVGTYVDLIQSFSSHTLSAEEFELRYLELFKRDGDRKSDAVFATLDELFSDVDAFCADPDLRDDDDTDEEELRRKCKVALTKLVQ